MCFRSLPRRVLAGLLACFLLSFSYASLAHSHALFLFDMREYEILQCSNKDILLGWPKSSFRFFCTSFQKNLNELLANPIHVANLERFYLWLAKI